MTNDRGDALGGSGFSIGHRDLPLLEVERSGY